MSGYLPLGENPQDTIDQEASRFGLKKSSGLRSPARNAAVGGAPNSTHLTGQGDDYTGDAHQMGEFTKYMNEVYGPQLHELFYDPVGGFKNGNSVGAIGKHGDHVHIAWGSGGAGSGPAPFDNSDTKGSNLPDVEDLFAEYGLADNPDEGEPIKLSTTQAANEPALGGEPRDTSATRAAMFARNNYKVGGTVDTSNLAGRLKRGEITGEQALAELEQDARTQIGVQAGLTPDETARYLGSTNVTGSFTPEEKLKQIERGQYNYSVPSDIPLRLQTAKRFADYDLMTPQQKEAEAYRIAATRRLTAEERQHLGFEGGLMHNLANYGQTAAIGGSESIGKLVAGGARLARHIPAFEQSGVAPFVEQVGKATQEVARQRANMVQPAGVGGEIARSTGSLAVDIAASELTAGQAKFVAPLTPAANQALHQLYWAANAGTEALGSGATPEEAFEQSAKAVAILSANRPLAPLVGELNEGLMARLGKTAVRTGLGGATGYAMARAEGATPESALAQGIQFGGMNVFGGHRAAEEHERVTPTTQEQRAMPEYLAGNNRRGAFDRGAYEAYRAMEEREEPSGERTAPTLIKKGKAAEAPSRTETEAANPDNDLFSEFGLTGEDWRRASTAKYANERAAKSSATRLAKANPERETRVVPDGSGFRVEWRTKQAQPERVKQQTFGEVTATEAKKETATRPASVEPVHGSDVEIHIPGEDKTYPARYVVHEGADVEPSHNPMNFEANGQYEHRNDRDYSDKTNAMRVIDYAQNLKPGYVVGESPDAVNGPPIIDTNRNALGGNNRLMAIQRAYAMHPEMAKAYRDSLIKNAAKFGLDPEKIGAMEQPILSREVTGPHEPQKAITDFNKTGTAALSQGERAIAESRRVPADVIDDLSDRIDQAGPDATLATVMGSDQGAEVINKLIERGVFTQQERPQLLTSGGKVTTEGKARVERLMIGRVFRDLDQLEGTPDDVRNKVQRIVPSLVRTAGNPEWDITPLVSRAVDALQEARAHGIKNLDDLPSQKSLVAGMEFTPQEIAVAKVLDGKPTEAARIFKEYAADEAANRPGATINMFGMPSHAEAFKRSFGVEPEAKKAVTPVPTAHSTETAKSGEGKTGQLPVEDFYKARADEKVKAYPGKLKIEKGPGLDAEQRKIEARAVHQLESDVEGHVERYLKANTKNGVVTLNTDDARELFPEYADEHQSRALHAQAVQEPASSLIKEIWTRLLDEPGRTNRVLFTAGGGGSGKTTAIGVVERLSNLREQADVVFDTTMSSLRSSDRKLREALASGRDVTVIFTYTPTEKAAVQAFGRGINNGRTVPDYVLAQDHFGAPRTFLSLYEKYKDDPRVLFNVIDNSGTKDQITEKDIDFLRDRIHTENEGQQGLADKEAIVRKAIDDEYRKRESANPGTVPDYIYRGFRGENPEAPGEQPVAGERLHQRTERGNSEGSGQREVVRANPPPADQIAEIKERRSDVLDRLRKKINESANKLSSGIPIDTETVSLLAELAKTYIDEGVVRFKDAAHRFLQDFGADANRLTQGFERAWDSLQKDVAPQGKELGGLFGEDNGQTSTDRLGADVHPAPKGNGQGEVSEASGDRTAGNSRVRGARGGKGSVPTLDFEGNARSGSPGTIGAPVHPGDGTAGERDATGEVGDRGGSSGREQLIRTLPPDFTAVDNPSQIGAGSPKQKYRKNIDAISLLRTLEAEGRTPTPEEQSRLAQYTGWGQFAALFDEYGYGNSAREWAREREELKSLLSPEEWTAAGQSILNAHYTAPQLVQSMWDMVRRLGFRGGRVLEPALGSGNFFALMPPDLKNASKLTGIELDPTTGKIAKYLYPNQNVQIKGFQESSTPDGFYDLAISNVPFGDYKVNDPKYNKYNANIHDYFFLKALDQVRPGGVVAFITSTGTMDKQYDRIRREIAKRADLVAAMRFPEDTFQKNAGTAVVTDLLVLKRRAPGEEPSGPAFAELKGVKDPDNPYLNPIRVNEYYADNPDQILGRLDRKSRLYGGGDNHVSRTDDFENRLNAAIKRLPQDIITERAKQQARAFEPEMLPAPGEVKQHGFAVKDGKLFVKQGDLLVKQDAQPATIARIEKMLGVRDAMREVFNAQIRGEDAEAARKTLNTAYDQFVKKHGYLNDAVNVRAFADDPDAGPLRALEVYNQKTKTAKKADVFTKDTIRSYDKPERADSAASALSISLYERGGMDLDRIGALLGTNEEGARQKLVDEGLAFEDPRGGVQWNGEYLSGNVKVKLAEAREAADLDPRFRRNVAALERVQPDDVEQADIDIRVGAPWVPPDDYKNFVAHLLGGEAADYKIDHIPGSGWTFDSATSQGVRATHSAKATTEWGTSRAPFDDVFEAAMNGRSVKVFDREPGGKSVLNHEESAAAAVKMQEIRNRFRDWVWEDTDRATRLHRSYNDVFNNTREMDFEAPHYKGPDGEYRLPGQSPLSLRKHMADAIFRVVAKGRALLAHEVGTGKTRTMIGSAMELRRMGLAKKPAIAVPKSVITQFVRDARAMYPAARIVSTIDTPDAFSGANRKKFAGRIATGDWDLVILTHDNIDMMPMKPEVVQDFIGRELNELDEVIAARRAADGGNSDSRQVKQMKKQRERLQQRLQETLGASKKDDAVFFEETGIDHLFVDEAHKYKSLPVYTTRERIKGIPTSRSDRATNMLMRSQWLREQTGGRGLVMATGTPIANTMVELYNMQRYLQPDMLKERGIENFDDWANTFGETQTRMEHTVTGEMAPVSRFSRYVNVPELMSLARQVMDVRWAADLPELVRPTRKDQVVAVPMSDTQREYLNVLKSRASSIKQNPRNAAPDNMLVVTGDGRKSAIDHRLAEPFDSSAPREESKVDALVKNVLDINKKNPGKTQMIFSDMGVSNTEWGFHLYKDIVNRLVNGGIPRDKIIDFSSITDTQRKLAAQRLDKGEALVAIGSTDKLGTGVNAQTNLLALHHLDAPWLPASVEQRDGRGWRDGNKNPEINIYRYVTEGSFDAYLWQLLDNKAQFIKQAMKADKNARAFEDTDAEILSEAAVQAIASGDPDLMKRVQLDDDISGLEMQARRHRSDKQRIEREIDWKDQVIGSNRRGIADLEGDAAALKQTEDRPFEITLDGTTYADRKDASFELTRLATNDDVKPGVVGEYRGFEIEKRFIGLRLKRADSSQGFDVNINVEEPQNTIRSLDSLKTSINRRTENLTREIEEAEKNKVTLMENAAKPFKYLDKLNEKKDQRDALVRQMMEREKARAAERAAAKAAEDAAQEGAERDSEGGFVALDILGAPEIAEKAKEVAATFRSARDAWRRVFNPSRLSGEARATSLSLRENISRMQQSIDQVEFAMQSAHKLFGSMHPDDAAEIWDRAEHGLKQSTPELNQIVGHIRQIMSDDAAQVRALGTGKLEAFIENYMPRYWDKTKATPASMDLARASKRPMEGKKSFTKPRTYEYFKDGLVAGEKPLSTNPIDYVLWKHAEMQKYIAAHESLNEMKREGMAVFARTPGAAPSGWVTPNDNLFARWGKSESGELVLRGHYYVPAEAASVINNYTSKGLRGEKWFRGYLTAANALNQMQLGFSAFHAGFVSLDAIISNNALAIYQLSHGHPLKALLTSGMGLRSLAAPIEYAWRGRQITSRGTLFGKKRFQAGAWYDPAAHPELEPIMDALNAGGGRARMDSFYRTNITARMMDAFKKGTLPGLVGGVMRAPFAAAEQAMKPVMDKMVPAMKAGAIMKMAEFELARFHEREASGDAVSRDEVRDKMAKIVDSVDNRMGQLIYDNLFWNKAAKDLGMASVRSLGWNLGDIREIGGGVLDTLENVKNLTYGNARALLKGEAKTGLDVSHRMAYLVSLPVTVGLIGGLSHYLMTGTKPEDLTDYFFPWTGGYDDKGNKQRVSFPSYMKDIWPIVSQRTPGRAAATLGKMAVHKLNPLLSTIAEMLQNENYYGVKIHNEDDPFIKQRLDDLKHIAKTFEPFAVRGVMKMRESGAPLKEQIAPMIGITPAPRNVNQSAAVELAQERRLAKMPSTPRTEEQAERSRLKSDLANLVRRGKIDEAKQQTQEAIKAGKLAPADAAEIQQRGSMQILEYNIKKLSLSDALDVYFDPATTPQEKRRIAPLIKDKADRFQPERHTQEEIQTLRPRVLKFLQTSREAQR